MRAHSRPFACASTLSLVVLMAGCGATPDAILPGSQAAVPAVVAVGAQVNGVAANRIQSVQFDQAMDPASINNQTFRVTDATGKLMPGLITYSADYRVAGFQPDPALQPTSTYAATLTTGIANAAGVHLARNYTYTFTTRAELDTSALFVSAVSPSPGATCVSTNATVTVTFNEGLRVSTLNSANLFLTDSTGATLPAQISYNVATSVATLTPLAPLPPDLVTLTANGETDAAGVAMKAAYISTFSTRPCAGTGEYVLGTISLSGSAGQFAVDSADGQVFVGDSNGVSVIDEATRTISSFIPFAKNATIEGLTYNPATGRLYVVDTVSPLVWLDVHNLNHGGPIRLPGAAALAINTTTNKLYVSDFNSTVTIVDGESNAVLASLAVPGVRRLAVDPGANRIYAAQDLSPGNVAVIDGATDQVVASAATTRLTYDVGVNSTRHLIYTTNDQAANVINGATNAVTATIPLPGRPNGIAVDSINGRVYVTNSSMNAVQVIDGATDQVVGSIAVGNYPLEIAIDQQRGLLFVTDLGDALLYVVRIP